MPMSRISRRLLASLGALVLLGAGYTAGFLLAPPEQPAITRNLPPEPHSDEVPAPHQPTDMLDDA